MTTIERIKDFLDGITYDGAIFEHDKDKYIVFDTRLERSDRRTSLYYLALLLISNVPNDPFEPQFRLLEVSHLNYDLSEKKLYLEMYGAPEFETIGGIIRWEDQKRFDNFMEAKKTNQALSERVSLLRQECLKEIRNREK
ncbi:hypothetical protein AB9P05_20680 [Roseivirga sp. BDSF3-8]|uniref:hypothetical protein n=1 Tax=Roseivirga sp. BDSF3-8 TaxID=3241598 RepID=UPI003531DF92